MLPPPCSWWHGVCRKSQIPVTDSKVIQNNKPLHVQKFQRILFFTKIQFICNVVLISAEQQSDSFMHIYTFFFLFISVMAYHGILSIVLCAPQCCLAILYIIACIHQPQIPIPSIPHLCKKNNDLFQENTWLLGVFEKKSMFTSAQS